MAKCQVVSTEAYRAHISIYDYKNSLIRELDQEFGYKGEMNNPARVTAKGLVSYLVWDAHDDDGHQ